MPRARPTPAPDPLEVCVARLRSEADVLARYGDERGAVFARAIADEVDAARTAWRAQPLTLAQAADESGLSIEGVRKAVSERRLPQAGETGRPRVLRGDLHQRRTFDPARAALASHARDRG